MEIIHDCSKSSSSSSNTFILFAIFNLFQFLFLESVFLKQAKMKKNGIMPKTNCKGKKVSSETDSNKEIHSAINCIFHSMTIHFTFNSVKQLSQSDLFKRTECSLYVGQKQCAYVPKMAQGKSEEKEKREESKKRHKRHGKCAEHK